MLTIHLQQDRSWLKGDVGFDISESQLWVFFLDFGRFFSVAAVPESPVQLFPVLPEPNIEDPLVLEPATTQASRVLDHFCPVKVDFKAFVLLGKNIMPLVAFIGQLVLILKVRLVH